MGTRPLRGIYSPLEKVPSEDENPRPTKRAREQPKENDPKNDVLGSETDSNPLLTRSIAGVRSVGPQGLKRPTTILQVGSQCKAVAPMQGGRQTQSRLPQAL